MGRKQCLYANELHVLYEHGKKDVYIFVHEHGKGEEGFACMYETIVYSTPAIET